MFCSDLNPSFGLGPYATRRCRDDTTWSKVDTSQCSIRSMQQSTIVVYSIYVEVDSTDSTNITSAEIMQVSYIHFMYTYLNYSCAAKSIIY